MATGLNGTLEYTSRNWAAYNGSRIRIDWSETYDVATNTSVVTFSNARLTIRGADGSTWVSMLLKANDENVISSSAGRGDFGGSMTANTEREIKYSGSYLNKSISVVHDSDGTKSITVTASGMRVVNSSYGRGDTFSDESTVITLTDIPRASGFNVSGTEIGAEMSFSIQKAVPAFTHKLYYKHGTDTYTLIAEDVDDTYSWTIPEALGEKIPAAASGTWTLKCETYNGAALMGENVKTVTLTVPNYSLTGSGWYSASYSNTGTAAAGINKPVKGYSKLTYSVTASGVTTRYGATLNAPTVTVNGSAIPSGQTITALSSTVTFRISDSRGKTLTETVTITAYDYSSPTVTSISAARCDSSGTADDEGMFWYAQATANISPIDGANSYTLTAAIKSAGGSYGAENTLVSGAKSVFGGALSLTASYVVRIRITDALGNSAQIEILIPTSAVTFSARNGGNGFAFGKYAEADELLDVAWDERVRGDLTVDGGGNIAKADTTVSSNIDAEYDSAMFRTTNATLGTFPSAVGSRYGAGLTLPYRNAHGNTKPDLAGQIWIPNGDDAGAPNDLFFRTSLANSWNAWQQICKTNDFAYRAIQGSVAAVYNQYVSVVSTSLPAGYAYLVLAIVGTTVSNDIAYGVRLTGCDYSDIVRPNAQFRGGGTIYGFVTPKSSATTVAVEYNGTFSTSHNATATMLILRFPKMSSF